MTFFPKFLVFGALLVSLLLAVILLSAPGVEAQPLPTALPSLIDATTSTPASTAQGMGKATLDLTLLAKVNNIDEADNARWSLVRSVSGAFGVYTPQATVDWKELRQVSVSGSITLPARRGALTTPTVATPPVSKWPAASWLGANAPWPPSSAPPRCAPA
jgi:hypothetical protein